MKDASESVVSISGSTWGPVDMCNRLPHSSRQGVSNTQVPPLYTHRLRLARGTPSNKIRHRWLYGSIDRWMIYPLISICLPPTPALCTPVRNTPRTARRRQTSCCRLTCPSTRPSPTRRSRAAGGGPRRLVSRRWVFIFRLLSVPLPPSLALRFIMYRFLNNTVILVLRRRPPSTTNLRKKFSGGAAVWRQTHSLFLAAPVRQPIRQRIAVGPLGGE